MTSQYTARLGYKGMRGFDCNTPLQDSHLQSALADGYSYVLRYFPRHTQAKIDITPSELLRIGRAGLGFMGVQHVESDTAWTPTVDKGTAYGFTAGGLAKQYGLALGTTIFCDLEGVHPDVTPDEVITYCKAWHTQVSLMGMHPGLYVGWHAGLNASDLYYKLPFNCYWSAYNLNLEKYPVKRGVCMKQHKQVLLGHTNIWIDPNVIVGDNFSGFPMLSYLDNDLQGVSG